MAPKRGRSDDAAEAPDVVAAATAGTAEQHARGKEHAQKLLDFINYSWTPFHAVDEAARRLTAAGFTRISEREPW